MLRRRILNTSLISLSILLLSGLALGSFQTASPPVFEGQVWQRMGGPPGGLGYDIRVNFDDPDIWYVTDAHSGFHISTDRGLTWVQSNQGIERRFGTVDVPVFSATVDPHDPDIIWIGTQLTGHIYKSTDGGGSWVAMDEGIGQHGGLSFRGFTVDPRSSDVVYAAAEVDAHVLVASGRTDVHPNGKGGRVFRTDDGGRQWQLIWEGDALARYIWIDPTNPDVLYISTGFFDRFPLNLPEEFSPTNAGGFGVYKSTDAGATWILSGEANGLEDTYVSALYMKPDDPLTLLAAAGSWIIGMIDLPDGDVALPGGLYITQDGAETWTKLMGNEAFVAVEYCEKDPDIAYAASANAVYRSGDGGLTWDRYPPHGTERDSWGPPGLYPGVPVDIQIDPASCDRLLINNYIGGNFASVDGGMSWDLASTGYSGSSITQVHVDPADPQHVIAATTMAPFQSFDGGVTWSSVSYGDLMGGLMKMAFDPTDLKHAIGSNERAPSQIFETTDAGHDWTVRLDLRDILMANYDESEWQDGKVLVFDLEYAPSDPTYAYAATLHPPIPDEEFPNWKEGLGILRSTDGGRSWSLANDFTTTEMGFAALAIHPKDPQQVFAVDFYGQGVLVTEDGGSSWEKRNGSMGNRFGELHDIVIDADNPNRMFAGGLNGLFRSEDGGQSWRQISAGLDPAANVNSILLDPTDRKIVYIATLELGAYVSLDGGDSFSPLGQVPGGERLPVVDLAVAHDGSVVYGAVGLQGVYRLGTPTAVVETPQPEAADETSETTEASASTDDADAVDATETTDTSADSTTASVGALTWVRTGGPPGGTGYDIRYNFDDWDTWYVTDAGAGVHISLDNGLTWQDSNTGIPGQSGHTGDGRPVFCLTVDPHDPQILWCGTDKTGHIYRSTDGGRTWSERENGIEIEYDTLTFRGFTVDPRSSDIVYAMGEITLEALGGPSVWGGGTGGVVYKTTDAGENWEEIWNGGMPSAVARYLWINPEDPDVLYVSTGIFDRGAVGDAATQAEAESGDDPFGGVGILKSTDGGETWRILGKENGFRNLALGSLYMHPEDPDTLLAAAGHVYDPFGSWYMDRLQEQDLPGPMGIYRTTDGGETWTQTLESYEIFCAVEISETNPDIAYAASNESVHRSTDGGQTWTLVAGNGWGPPGISAGFPIDMQCDPRDPDRIFINNYGGGNFLSEDGGKTWINASTGYTGEDSFSVAVDPSDPALVYAAGFGGIWASKDGGTTWYGITNSPEGHKLGYDFVAADPSTSGHLLAGKIHIVESSDGGSEWTYRWGNKEFLALDPTLPDSAMIGTSPIIKFSPSDPKTVYIGFGSENYALAHEPPSATEVGVGVIVSTDGGTTWQRAVDDDIERLSVFDLAVDPTDTQRVYVATGVGLYRTADGGQDWAAVSGLPQDRPLHAVAINPLDVNHLLVGIEGTGIYRSTDGGVSWQRISAGLEPNSGIHDIVFDPVNPAIVYASDVFSGIYRSTDGGEIWAKINNGLKNRYALGLAISTDGNHVYAAIRGDGIYRLDVNGLPPIAAPDNE